MRASRCSIDTCIGPKPWSRILTEPRGKPICGPCPWHEAIIEAELAKARLVVNASGVGTTTEESPVPPDLLPDDLYVLDLVLNRAETPLMREAAGRGGTVANGQGSFLVAQAAAFQLWTGAEAPIDVMRTALAEHLGLPEEGLAVVGD